LSHVELQKHSHKTTDQKTGTKVLWTLQNSGKNRNPIISTRTRSTLENTQCLSCFAPRTIQVLIRSTEDTICLQPEEIEGEKELEVERIIRSEVRETRKRVKGRTRITKKLYYLHQQKMDSLSVATVVPATPVTPETN